MMIEKKYTYPVVLTIAGSDSGGGAGIQADLKTFSALGCYGTSAITAVTVQNTLGVKAVHAIPSEILRGQIQAVMEDLKPRAIKIGMVQSRQLIEVICETLIPYSSIPIVFDPVMIASSGDNLLNKDTIGILKDKLVPLATLITPNLDETSVLTGYPVSKLKEMENAAKHILNEGANAVLVKGGHLPESTVSDFYLDRDGNRQVYSSRKLTTRNTHGTGCTLSSAIAAYLAQGFSMTDAVQKAIRYVKTALAGARDVCIGEGHGPLNHFFAPLKMIKYEVK